jgi:hypothetical protein
MTSKQDLLMVSLTEFFKNKNNLNKMLRIVNGKSPISLRILDWFATNYSKKNNTSYDIIDKDGNIKNFFVFTNYKCQLKAYSKKQFDPFCRRDRISVFDHDNKEIVTTVGQLNFFRWAIQNKILDYVEKNLKIIETDMNNSIRHIYNKNNKEKSPDGKNKRRKRHELSISASKTVNKHNVKIVIEFN